MRKVKNGFVWMPRKSAEKIVLGIDDLVISFFVGFTFCLYLLK